MATSTAPDKVKLERKKKMLGNMVDLIHLGGFIEEEIHSMVEALYPAEVVNIAYKYADIETGFQQVLQETEKVYHKERRDACINDYRTVNLKGDFSKEKTTKWILEQTAKYTALREKEKELHKGMLEWENWDLNDKDRSALYRMNALEYRIFELGNGIGVNSQSKSAEEIAAMSEFNCEPEYIREVQKYIRGYFIGRPEAYSTIRQASKENLQSQPINEQ